MRNRRDIKIALNRIILAILSCFLCLAFVSLVTIPLISWEFVKRHPGIMRVILGVVGEGAEILAKLLLKHRAEKLDRWLETIGATFWAILVIGLAVELLEAGKLDSQVAEMEAASASLIQSNLVLQTRLLELQQKLSPRMITMEQSLKFMKFVEGKPRGHQREM